MGLFWYFFALMLEDYKNFFLFVFHVTTAIFTIPMCLRFPESPIFIFYIQCITNALFKPHPVIADYALYIVIFFNFYYCGNLKYK